MGVEKQVNGQSFEIWHYGKWKKLTQSKLCRRGWNWPEGIWKTQGKYSRKQVSAVGKLLSPEDPRSKLKKVDMYDCYLKRLTGPGKASLNP